MIAVIVLNWNGGADTVECVRSIQRSTTEVFTLVVDNASGDDSIEVITAALPDVQLLLLDENYGYAGGNNRGIEWALARGFEHICVLNNDTEVAPEALERMLEAVGAADLAVSPRITYLGRDGDWYVGATATGPLDMPAHDQQAPTATAARWETDFLTGCCILASAGTWRKVGLFDEAYFLIFEDSDWSVRARRSGVGLQVVGDAVVGHQVSASFQRTNGVGLYYFTRNALRYVWSTSGRRTMSSVWQLVIKPGLRDVRHEGRSGLRALLIRSTALAHAMTGVGGRAQGRALRTMGLGS